MNFPNSSVNYPFRRPWMITSGGAASAAPPSGKNTGLKGVIAGKLKVYFDISLCILN